MRARQGIVMVGAVVVAVAVGACQGAADSDLFDQEKGNALDGGGGTANDGGGSSSSGELPVDDASTSSSSSSGGGGSSSGESSSSSSGAPAVVDDGNTLCPDGANGEYCTAAKPLCCGRRNAADNSIGPLSCEASCAANFTEISCDDDGDCEGGKICCIRHSELGQPQSVKCEATCQWVNTNTVSRMCDPNKPSAFCNAFQAGWSCKAHDKLPGLYLCLP